VTVRTGHFDIPRGSFGLLSDDPRIQAFVAAFSFGALLEALAGFGAPVAICSVMLVALGFEPVRAVVVAPVAFGALAHQSVCGVAFAVARFSAPNDVSAQLTDIGAALVGAGALVAVPHARRARARAGRGAGRHGARAEVRDPDRDVSPGGPGPRREPLRAARCLMVVGKRAPVLGRMPP
jgi:lactate permease